VHDGAPKILAPIIRHLGESDVTAIRAAITDILTTPACATAATKLAADIVTAPTPASVVPRLEALARS
jgi:hypothetical protein